MPGDAPFSWQRLDKWLWCARFLKRREDCARLVAEGLIRINAQPTDKPHARLRVGDVLTIPGVHVRVVRVLGLSLRRGPAAEARRLFEEIGEAPADGSPVPCNGGQRSAYPAADEPC
jgi:ribosome-associated heat shock protein Hsp15